MNETVMNFDEQQDAFWREILIAGRQGFEAKYVNFCNSLAGQVSHLPQHEQERLAKRLYDRNAEYIAIAKQDLGALKTRLGVADASVAGNRLAQVAVETAVRATVWESVAALFRLFR